MFRPRGNCAALPTAMHDVVVVHDTLLKYALVIPEGFGRVVGVQVAPFHC